MPCNRCRNKQTGAITPLMEVTDTIVPIPTATVQFRRAIRLSINGINKSYAPSDIDTLPYGVISRLLALPDRYIHFMNAADLEAYNAYSPA